MDRLFDPIPFADFMLWDGVALLGVVAIIMLVGMVFQNARLAIILVACIPCANIAMWATNYVLPGELGVSTFLSPVVTVGLLIGALLFALPWVGMDAA